MLVLKSQGVNGLSFRIVKRIRRVLIKNFGKINSFLSLFQEEALGFILKLRINGGVVAIAGDGGSGFMLGSWVHDWFMIVWCFVYYGF